MPVDVIMAVLGIEAQHVQLIFNGVMGGLVRWAALRLTLRDGLVSIFVGAACAFYFGPIGVPLVEKFVGVIVTDMSIKTRSSAFIFGLLGVGVIGFIIDVWNIFRDQRRKSMLGTMPTFDDHGEEPKP